jgi:hypothetical protein
VPIQESPANTTPEQIVWIDLEDGVQIQFPADGDYRTGDYWLIPARVTTANVEWPQDDELNPQPLPPRGIEHHYGLLGFASWANRTLNIENVRCEFWPLFFGVVQSSIQDATRNVVRAEFLSGKSGFVKVEPVKAPKRKSGPPKKLERPRLKARLHEAKQFAAREH